MRWRADFEPCRHLLQRLVQRRDSPRLRKPQASQAGTAAVLASPFISLKVVTLNVPTDPQPADREPTRAKPGMQEW